MNGLQEVLSYFASKWAVDRTYSHCPRVISYINVVAGCTTTICTMQHNITYYANIQNKTGFTFVY